MANEEPKNPRGWMCAWCGAKCENGVKPLCDVSLDTRAWIDGFLLRPQADADRDLFLHWCEIYGGANDLIYQIQQGRLYAAYRDDLDVRVC
jgi:hypothetical protein